MGSRVLKVFVLFNISSRASGGLFQHADCQNQSGFNDDAASMNRTEDKACGCIYVSMYVCMPGVL